MKKLCTSIFILLLIAACQAQDRQGEEKLSSFHVGGPCEGCEAIYEFGDRKLLSVDTLPGFAEKGQKLKLTGTIYQRDGKTPASGVILYIYHTNQQGIYPTKGDESGWGRRHGYIRGWIKTDKDGNYTFYTLRPGAYPDRGAAEHIHATIKEPGVNEYYIDDYLFDDDLLLTSSERRSRQNRGGSGILTLKQEGEIWTAQRDIILGLNIPDYE